MNSVRVVWLCVLNLILASVSAWGGEDRAAGPSAFRVVGYLPDYRATEFDPAAAGGLTDLIVFSAELNADGGIDRSGLAGLPWARLRAFKTRERVRLLLCVGGWGRSAHFATVAGAPEKRAAFTRDAVRLCLEERLDGIDLDWEHPKDGAEQEVYGKLLSELRGALEPHGLVLTVTVAAWQVLPGSAYAVVDAIQVMAYDHNGRHSTFESAEADIQTLLDAGAPREKLVLGMPLYGRGIVDRGRVLTYGEIVGKHRLSPGADEIDEVYFNGPDTIRRKAKFALDSGLGGVMLWELGQDAAGERSLLRVVREVVDSRRNPLGTP